MLALIVVLVLVAVSGWLWFAGPCWVYKFESAARTPSRCLMQR